MGLRSQHSSKTFTVIDHFTLRSVHYHTFAYRSGFFEILCHYDEAAMNAFTEHYAALASIDQESLSLWELYASSAAVAKPSPNMRRKTPVSIGFLAYL